MSAIYVPQMLQIQYVSFVYSRSINLRVIVQISNLTSNHRSELDAPTLLATNTTFAYNVSRMGNPPHNINLLLIHTESLNKTLYQFIQKIGEQMRSYYYWKGVRYMD